MVLACASTSSAQSLQPAVRVNGAVIVATQPVRRIGDEWFVPLTAVATATGADLRINPTTQAIRVLRSDGAVVDYDGRTGQLRQGFVQLGDVRNFREIRLTGDPATVLFPLSGIVPLLGVSARYDADRDVLDIDTSPPSPGNGPGAAPSFRLASQDYTYSLTSNGQISGQYGQMQGEALLGAFRVYDNVLSNWDPRNQRPQLTQGTVKLALRDRLSVTFGDQSAYSGIDALGAAIRGVGYEQRAGSFFGDVYVGQAVGSVTAVFGSAGQAAYDTQFAGFSFRHQTKRSMFSFAGDTFKGGSRQGRSAGLGFSADAAANQLKVQGVVGDFSGDTGGMHVAGPAYGVSLTDNLNSRWLSLAGTWERYTKNFLTIRDDARYNAVERNAASATVRPNAYLSATSSITNSQDLLVGTERTRVFGYGANAMTPGPLPIQVGYFKSIQTGGANAGGKFDLSQYSIVLPGFNRFSASAFYSEVRLAGDLSTNLSLLVAADFGRAGRFGAHDQDELRPHDSNRYGLDWSHSLGPGGTFIRIGVDRLEQREERPLLTPTVAGTIPLPWNQRLQVTYIAARDTRTFQVQIGGPLIRHRELVGANGGPMTMIVQVSLRGRVYDDVNLNGRFDAGVDRPLAGVEMLLDEEQPATTNAAGYFEFNQISPGTHRLRGSLERIPAALVFRDGESRIVAVAPYGGNQQDFPVIPTGQISGRVVVTRITGLEREPLNQPVPDAHILTAGDRDTFSEADGTFVLGDLPPGRYVLRVDPSTVPSGYTITPASQAIDLKPNDHIRNADFQLARTVIQQAAP